MTTEWGGDKETLEKIEAATDRLRETVREANGVRKDLSQLLKDINKELTDAEDLVSARLQEHVEHHTKELAALFAKLGKDMSQRLFRRFDEITNILLGRADEVDDVDLKATAIQVRAAMGGGYRASDKIPDILRRPK